MNTMFTLWNSWGSLSTFQTQQTKRTECCVLRTHTTPEPRYLILSTSAVLTTGDTSSTTTAGLILRIRRGILFTPGFHSVKWKCTVKKLIILYRTLIMLVMNCVNIYTTEIYLWFIHCFLIRNFNHLKCKYKCIYNLD